MTRDEMIRREEDGKCPHDAAKISCPECEPCSRCDAWSERVDVLEDREEAIRSREISLMEQNAALRARISGLELVIRAGIADRGRWPMGENALDQKGAKP